MSARGPHDVCSCLQPHFTAEKPEARNVPRGVQLTGVGVGQSRDSGDHGAVFCTDPLRPEPHGCVKTLELPVSS